MRLKKIAVVGGGPGGLYFSILTKKAMPTCEIDVFERNKPDDSFGFGVVFSDETLSEFLTRDPDSYDLIRSEFAYWDELDVARDGEKVRITGNGFCGCSRKTLLQLLHKRCQDVGVNLYFESDVSDVKKLQKDYDLVVACDGIGSVIRTQYANEFGTEINLQRNRFVWMGSSKPLDAFTYFFRNTEHGPLVAHTYQYQEGMSTWIFECTPETYANWQFEESNEASTTTKLAAIFKEELAGHSLITNKSHWRNFPHVSNKNWHFENVVLLGDAKATAHYSIGSGTKLAMESAIALSDAVVANSTDIAAAFAHYEKARRTRVEMIQHAANVSLDWFEKMDRHIKLPFYQFAFGVMTRAKKVTFENLSLRDKTFTTKVLNEFATLNTFPENTPAAFTPFQLRAMRLENRIVMAPMGQYMAEDGLVNNWHLVHYGSRATGGVALIMAELTAVSPTGRITLGCAGIYNTEQIAAWKTISDFIHAQTKTKIGIQLGHSGRKGATKKLWEGTHAPIDNPWELISASPIAFTENLAIPKEITLRDMDELCTQFVQAAKNADAAGFDMIELQAHHGFLLASFLSPLTNKRSDEFGGTIENRLKFPLRVFTAMRAVFPEHKPMSVRISASDWAEGGISAEEVLAISNAFKTAGADLISVSSGLTVAHQNPQVGRMYQVPFSETIRNTVHIPTVVAGSISDIDQINTIILSGKADLVALGKPLLLDASFVRKAQAYEQFESNDIPLIYQRGKAHLFPHTASERKMLDGMKKALKPESHKKP